MDRHLASRAPPSYTAPLRTQYQCDCFCVQYDYARVYGLCVTRPPDIDLQ